MPAPDPVYLVSSVLAALQASGVAAQPRNTARDLWADTCAQLDYFPVDYSSPMIDYMLAYWSGNDRVVADASVILLHDNRPCGIWPLSLMKNGENGMRIGSNGGSVLPPLFVSGFARKSLKSATSACFTALETACGDVGQQTIEVSEAYADGEGLSDWHDRLMIRGAKAEVRHDLFVDLRLPMADIKSAFRKSYKALVTSGSKLWNVRVVDGADLAQWNEFHQLHIAVAGRATRCEESWEIQHDAVASGDAFFVCLRDATDRMVGAGLFQITRDEGLYAVGAYDRALFDKPLGHVVQYHAIEEMKRRGLRWYKLGACPYPGDHPAPTNKELSIANFKLGFATHHFPRYLLSLHQGHTLAEFNATNFPSQDMFSAESK